jgi:hypothetical protein
MMAFHKILLLPCLRVSAGLAELIIRHNAAGRQGMGAKNIMEIFEKLMSEQEQIPEADYNDDEVYKKQLNLVSLLRTLTTLEHDTAQAHVTSRVG